MGIAGKIAVITGGTKGIGKAIAEALLRLGVKVFVCGRDGENLENVLKHLRKIGNASGSVCDVSNDTEVQKMLAGCVETFGGIDILINNAGIGIFGKTVEDLEPEKFKRVIETNLHGTFYACHFAIPLMKKRNGGYIINISSLAGQNAHPKMAAYNASKFGLNGFTEALMQEVRQDNIKVTTISPGSVNTEFGDDEISDQKAWQLQPDDIAKVVVDLLNFPENALPSKVEIRPSKPPMK